jgi:hypothetical protein
MPTSQSAGLDRSGGKVPRPAGGSRTLDSWRGIRLRAPAAPEGALGPGPSAHPGAAPRPRRGVANGCCRAPRADVCGDAWLAKRATSRLGSVRRGRGPRHNSQGTAQQRTPLPNRRCAPQNPSGPIPQATVPVAAATAWVGPTGAVLATRNTPVRAADQGWHVLDLLGTDPIAQRHPPFGTSGASSEILRLSIPPHFSARASGAAHRRSGDCERSRALIDTSEMTEGGTRT